MAFVGKALVPGAIVTAALFLVVVLTGLRVIKVKFKVHRLLALILSGLVVIHALVGLYVMGIFG